MTNRNSESLTLNDKVILIAEDEPAISVYFKAILAPTGIQVIWTKNGEEAIKEFREHPEIGLVLMDIRMPKIDGYEATKRIIEISPNAKIIAQTAYVTTEEIEKCFAAGCIGFISKPINSDELIGLLVKHLI